MGHVIDKDGRRPDPKRAATTKNMQAPDNIASLQSFVGLANYYQIFISNMDDLCATPQWIVKKRPALGLDSRMPGGIWKNKEKTDVRPISYPL